MNGTEEVHMDRQLLQTYDSWEAVWRLSKLTTIEEVAQWKIEHSRFWIPLYLQRKVESWYPHLTAESTWLILEAYSAHTEVDYGVGQQ